MNQNNQQIENNQINDNQNESDNNDISWPQIKNYLHQNLTTLKIILILITLLFLYYVWQMPSETIQSQSGGAPGRLTSAMKGFGKGIDKAKGGLGKLSRKSPISGGFTMVFQFINGIFMIFGIVIILILIPTIPVIIFLVISYFICRRKLWDLRTM